MPDVVRLVGFGIASALLALTLRQTRPELALAVSLAAGLCLFAAVVGRLGEIVSAMRSLAERAELSDAALPLLLRILGIASLCELGAQMCRDIGEGGIAAKVEMGGKVMVLSLSLPVATALIELVAGLLP
ncbi:MAG TPA: stage III sporulation protein AD [Candidatus Avichristensenella intestinipullorum]|uniref:Stage III sporulation protein AD n=1 Tax=Candidatus Avichristensenella intestinipullorum TaxID=2840693 RepID=A0A9D0YUB0_9FIRM|nr:stage III sporulation protein AD [Candidatus Avichristensenella intestinipullorum]